MISLCCALTSKNLRTFTEVITANLMSQTSLVSEVIFVQTDYPYDKIQREWIKGGITFKLYGSVPYAGNRRWEQMICGHARGLHRAISLASSDWLWLTDPDVFLLNHVDEIYMGLMDAHELDVIGVSHFNPLLQCYLYHPCVINCLLRRSYLPVGSYWAQTDMWAGKSEPVMSVGSNWLVPGPCEGHVNPSGIYDTGCRLALQQGRWLSFYLETAYSDRNDGWRELPDEIYSLDRVKTNFGPVDHAHMPLDLLYHRTRGCRENADSYKKRTVELSLNRPV